MEEQRQQMAATELGFDGGGSGEHADSRGALAAGRAWLRREPAGAAEWPWSPVGGGAASISIAAVAASVAAARTAGQPAGEEGGEG